MEYFDSGVDAAAGLLRSYAGRARQVVPQSQLYPASVPPPVGNGRGLKGQYYDNKNLTGLKTTRTDAAVNFTWGTEAPAPLMGRDTFSARWTGSVKPRRTETYTIHPTSDGGVRLWVNGQLLVNKWINQTSTTSSGTTSIVLQAGVSYSFGMEFYDNSVDASAKLEWTSANQRREVVPPAQLYPAP